MPKVSIIVPVYNTEKYLKACIESILSQSFSDFELILSDDGSSDSSGKICDEYRIRDSRVIVIHKECTGVSDTRNVALDRARGKYITFVDSDDTIECDTIQICVQVLENTRADCVCFGYDKLDENGNVLFEHPNVDGTFYFRRESDKFEFLIKQILSHKLGWEVCFRMFRADIINHNNIRFNKDNIFGEDLFFTSVFTLYSEQCVSLSRRFYKYYERNSSAMAIRKDRAMLDEINSLSFYLHESIYDKFEETNNYYPLIHYLIFNNQFAKLKEDDFSELKNYVAKFEYYDFHKIQTEKLYSEIKQYESFIDKKERYQFKNTVKFLYDYDSKYYIKTLGYQKIINFFMKIFGKMGFVK